MTPDQMRELREKIMAALRKAEGIDSVEGLDFEDGRPLPIALNVDDTELFLELNVA